MKKIINLIEKGFSSLGDGFLNIFGAWNYRPTKKISYKKININKIIGRDLNDPHSGFQQDNKNLKKDWEKVLGKFK